MQKRCCSNLQQPPSTLRVRVVDFKAPCLFYREKGEEFTLDELVPEGICPDLFFQIYPQYLSLLYDGKKSNNKMILQCPGNVSKTYWNITTKALLLSPIINLARLFFRLIGRPKDIIDKKIIIYLESVEGTCPRGYSGKVKISFNQYSHLWKRRFFCPAVFYTIYPFLISVVNNNMKKEPLLIRCPADNASILFELIK